MGTLFRATNLIVFHAVVSLAILLWIRANRHSGPESEMANSITAMNSAGVVLVLSTVTAISVVWVSFRIGHYLIFFAVIALWLVEVAPIVRNTTAKRIYLTIEIWNLTDQTVIIDVSASTLLKGSLPTLERLEPKQRLFQSAGFTSRIPDVLSIVWRSIKNEDPSFRTATLKIPQGCTSESRIVVELVQGEYWMLHTDPEDGT